MPLHLHPCNGAGMGLYVHCAQWTDLREAIPCITYCNAPHSTRPGSGLRSPLRSALQIGWCLWARLFSQANVAAANCGRVGNLGR